jgi:23S rRNA maturation mini-RNase III
MGAQDNTEKVLRALHVLLSKSEPYEREPSKVIVDKQQMLDLLANLNTCIYQIMDEHELTKRSRDQAEREFRKQGDQIIWDASRKAEDVYAASILYMEEAMNRMQELMREADEKVAGIYAGLKEQMDKEERAVKTDQLELKSSLQTLVDTEKYLKLIEERNKELEKQKNEGKPEEEQESTLYADRQTGIKVNQEYLDKLGLALEEAVDEELDGPQEEPDEAAAKAQEAEIRVNLDADYFQWKEEQEKGAAPKEAGKPRTRAQEKARNKRHRK